MRDCWFKHRGRNGKTAAGDAVEFEVVTAPTGQAAARNGRVLSDGKRWGEGSLTSGIVAGLNE